MWPLFVLLALMPMSLPQERSPVVTVPPQLELGRAHVRAACDSAGLVEFPYACAIAGQTTFSGYSPDGPIQLELLGEDCRVLAVSAASCEACESALVFPCSRGNYVLRVRGPRPGALAHVFCVRGELNAAALDPAAADRFYWVSAFESAARRLDIDRMRRAALEIASIDGRDDVETLERELRVRTDVIEGVRSELERAMNWPRADFGRRRAQLCWRAYEQATTPEVDAFEFALLPDLLDVLARQGLHSQRLAAWTRLLDLVEDLRPRGHPQFDDALLNCAQITFEFGRFDEARTLALEWLSTDPHQRIDPDGPAWQRLRTLVAVVAISSGDTDLARALLEAADAAYRAHGLAKLDSARRVDFSVVQLNLVELDAADVRLSAAIRRLDGLGALDGLAEPHRTRMERFSELMRAQLAWRLGKPQLALSLVEGAAIPPGEIEVRARLDPSIELQLDELRALLLEHLGHSAEALELADENVRALKAQQTAAPARDFPSRDLGLRMFEQRLLRAIALAHGGELEVSEAELRVLRSELEASSSYDNDLLLRTLEQLAAVLLATDQLRESAEIENDVLERLRASGAAPPERLAQTLVNVCLCSVAAGDADASARTVRELCETLRARLDEISVLPAEHAEAMCARLRSHRDVALSVAGGLDDHPDAVASAFTVAETLRFAPCAFQAQWRRFADDPAVARARARLRQLASTESDSPLAARLVERDLVNTTQQRTLAQAELVELLEARGATRRRLSVDELARALAPSAAAIGYLRYDSAVALDGSVGVGRYLAHVVRPDGSLERVELGVAAPIDEAVAAHRSAVLGRTGSAEHVDRLAARVRELIWDPLLTHIADREELHVCLDDALHLVPLATLPLDGSIRGSILGDHWRIRVESDFDNMLRARELARVPSTMLALGGVDITDERRLSDASRGDARIPEQVVALPRSLEEVRHAAASFERQHPNSAALLTGDAATKAAFLEAAPRAGVLHLATHAYALDPDDATELLAETTPLALCGLMLSGFNRASQAARIQSVVSGAELAALDLSAVQIAVVSTCNSAVGVRRAGAGVASLRVALHAAGVRTVVSTLWSVDDAAALRFSRVFHEGLWVHRLSVSQAFENARAELRDAGAPVRDWGAWLLTGASD